MLTLHVTVPDQYTGDVMSDLNGKRAHVNGMNPQSEGQTTVDATVPAAEVQRYATDLRSITQGRGSFATEFSHYQQVPQNVAERKSRLPRLLATMMAPPPETHLRQCDGPGSRPPSVLGASQLI